jgi:hypothetical protein
MSMSVRTARIAIATTLVVILAVAITVVATPWWDRVSRNTYVAYFANTNGLYTGDEVRILGVEVGIVEEIDPQPNAARVTFSVDRQYPVPANVQAAILSPSLVSARAIQLVPAYSSGPKLADGAEIPKDRTAVPVEWDDLRQQLEKLTDSLQPTTPGGVSPVGEFINSAAANLHARLTVHDSCSSTRGRTTFTSTGTTSPTTLSRYCVAPPAEILTTRRCRISSANYPRAARISARAGQLTMCGCTAPASRRFTILSSVT